MKTEKIELVSYTKGEEVLNVITHFLGLILPIIIIMTCVPLCKGKTFPMVCVILYATGTALTFIASSLYHAVPAGDIKRLLRVIDHSAIFFAVAGTVTGCIPAVMLKAGTVSAVLMLAVSWGSVVLGLILTIFFFNKFKTLRMFIYIFSALICALLGIKTFFHLPIEAFLCLFSGGVILLIGCVLYKIGARKCYVHSLFHVFIVAGLSVFCYGIYNYVYLML